TSWRARIMIGSMTVFFTSSGRWNAWNPAPAKMGDKAMAAICLPTRRPAIAATDGISRRMRGLLPRHASEGHRTRDFLDEDLDDCALRCPRDIDHVLVELRDPVPLLHDVLDHELIDLAFDEGRLLDLGGLLHGLDGPAGAAGVAFEHCDSTFLDEAGVGPTAFLAEDVRVHVGLDSILDLLGRDLALEHDPSTFHRPRGPELTQEIREDHVGIPADRADDVLK